MYPILNVPNRSEIDFITLAKLKVFLECAKNSINIPNVPVDPLEFDFGPKGPAHIQPSTSTSTSNTPNDKRIKPVTQDAKKLKLLGQNFKTSLDSSINESLEIFCICKRKSYESQIYLTSGLFLPFLPRLVYLREHEEDPRYEVFVFEKMTPIVDRNTGNFNKCIRTDEPVIDAVTMAIHLLYELYLLHTHMGYVHSDISPNNVMFSSVNKIWKLNDFNQAMPIKKSLETVRIGGTTSYRAPESEKSGIFTTASDVYSIGYLLCFYIHDYLLYKRSQFQKTSDFSYEFNDICLLMITDDPEERITVREALKLFYRLLLKLKIPPKFEIYVRVRSCYPVSRKRIFIR